MSQYKTSREFSVYNAQNEGLPTERHTERPLVRPPVRPTERHTGLSTERPLVRPPVGSSKLVLKYVTKDHANSGNPEVWGPAFWFSLHNGAIYYPIKASPTWCERMKYFILGIPVMVPCEKCSDHATAYIEANYDNLDNAVSGRDALFKFYLDFHNFVNKRVGKKDMSLAEAYKIYSSKTQVTKLDMTTL